MTLSVFGDVLKEWRRADGVSQLELALRSGASQKHISFLESGRAQPSRAMVVALSDALDVPLGRRNELLLAAGFAPIHQRRALTDPELAPVTAAITRLLDAAEPYPAIVFDLLHDLQAANAAARRLQLFLFDARTPEELPAIARNALRGLMHPDGYRRHVKNWARTAAFMLRRFHGEIVASGRPPEATALLEELAGYPDIPSSWRHARDLDWRQPALTIDVEKDGCALSLFTTLTSLGGPIDITLHEIRIETFFPANPTTEAFMRDAQSAAG